MNKLMKNLGIFFLLLTLNIGVFAQVDKQIYQGQPPVEEVDTTTKPIEKQRRRVFTF